MTSRLARDLGVTDRELVRSSIAAFLAFPFLVVALVALMWLLILLAPEAPR